MTSKLFSQDVAPTLTQSGYLISRSVQSTNSPRIKGKIFFRQNALGADFSRFDISPQVGFLSGGKPSPLGYNSVNSLVSEVNRVVPVTIRDDRYSARLKADERLRDQCASAALNLSEMWATRRQTADMVATTIGRIAKSYISLKKGRVKDAVKYLGLNYTPNKHKGLKKRTAPEAWLELQYGWKPLLGDLHTMLDVDWGIITGLIRASGTIDYSVGGQGRHSDGRLCTRAYQQKTRVNSRCIVSFNGSAFDAASRVGLTNPALLAWELLPFSFVVDWALPIGNYLERICTFQSVSISEYSATTTVTSRDYFSVEWALWFQKTGLIPSGATSQLVRRSYKTKARTLTGFSLNPPPTFKNPVSLGHVANSLSLLASAFKK